MKNPFNRLVHLHDKAEAMIIVPTLLLAFSLQIWAVAEIAIGGALQGDSPECGEAAIDAVNDNCRRALD